MNNKDSTIQASCVFSGIEESSPSKKQSNESFEDLNNPEKFILKAFRTFKNQCLAKFNNEQVSTSLQESPKSTSFASDMCKSESLPSYESRVRLVDSSKTDSKGVEELLSQSMPNQRDVSFEDIPFYCKLLILAQLDTVDICNLSMVSRHWSRVCSDQLLWRELTHRDMSKWSFLGHKSNPLLPLGKVSENVQKKVYYDEKYLEISLDFHKRLCARHDLNFKALYFHCAYQQQQVKQMMGCAADSSSTGAEPSSTSSGHNISSGQSLPRFFRSLWTRFTSGHGKVIMLGPGMESSNTSKIFQHLLWERPDILTTVRLLPGTQDGVGSGVELDFKGEKRFSLIALYSGNRQARSQRAGMERLQQSNIIEETNEVPASDVAGSLVTSANPSVQRFRFKLRDAVYNFLSQKDISCYLIYVVDATVTPCVEQFACNRLEINAVLSGMNSYESGSSEYDNATSLDGATRESSAFSFGNFLGRTYSQNCTRNRTPLLVLCCTATSTSPRIPCIEVASLLDLASIVDRSWLVQDVAVDNLRGLEDGLVWLFKQS